MAWTCVIPGLNKFPLWPSTPMRALGGMNCQSIRQVNKSPVVLADFYTHTHTQDTQKVACSHSIKMNHGVIALLVWLIWISVNPVILTLVCTSELSPTFSGDAVRIQMNSGVTQQGPKHLNKAKKVQAVTRCNPKKECSSIPGSSRHRVYIAL